MNYRQKCKAKGEWAFVKYKGDAAIYAVCQNCEFIQHGAYDLVELKATPRIDKLYKYCPRCGLKMHPFNGDEIYKIDRFPWE